MLLNLEMTQLEDIGKNLYRKVVIIFSKKIIFNRIASKWNNLPLSPVAAKTVNNFNNIIDALNICC